LGALKAGSVSLSVAAAVGLSRCAIEPTELVVVISLAAAVVVPACRPDDGCLGSISGAGTESIVDSTVSVGADMMAVVSVGRRAPGRRGRSTRGAPDSWVGAIGHFVVGADGGATVFAPGRRCAVGRRGRSSSGPVTDSLVASTVCVPAWRGDVARGRCLPSSAGATTPAPMAAAPSLAADSALDVAF
jgi:hypothetical protein